MQHLHELREVGMEGVAVSDLISRTEAIDVIRSMTISLGGKQIFHPEAKESVINTLDDLQSVDAEPVRHGFWKNDGNFLKCSECDRDFTMYDWEGSVNAYYWCPNCGAKMHTERTEDDR